MGLSDEVGARGEAIFTAAFLRLFGRERPYFSPHFLGEKFATLDFLVELIGVENSTPYFFVQVKSTGRGYKTVAGESHLRVRLVERDARRMKAYPAPTYLVGVDTLGERLFILSIDERTRGGLASMPARHELHEATLFLLYQEVETFWRSRDMKTLSSAFSV